MSVYNPQTDWLSQHVGRQTETTTDEIDTTAEYFTKANEYQSAFLNHLENSDYTPKHVCRVYGRVQWD